MLMIAINFEWRADLVDLLAVFGGSAVVSTSEYAVEGGQRIEATAHGNLSDRVLRVGEHQLGINDTTLLQVVVAGNAGEFLEETDEMRLGEISHFSELVNGQIFSAVIVDVAAYIKEGVHIYLLTLHRERRAQLLRMLEADAGSLYKKLNSKGMNASCKKRSSLLVFDYNLLKKSAKLVVALIAVSEDGAGEEGTRNGVEAVHLVENFLINLENNTLAVRRCTQRVKLALRNDNDIAFREGIISFVQIDFVPALKGHDDFEIRMPMRRIIF